MNTCRVSPLAEPERVGVSLAAQPEGVGGLIRPLAQAEVVGGPLAQPEGVGVVARLGVLLAVERLEVVQGGVGL